MLKGTGADWFPNFYMQKHKYLIAIIPIVEYNRSQ